MANKKIQKDFIVTYRSREHYEVLGWVRAFSIEEAKKKVQKELLAEVKFYNVKEARIGEWKGEGSIFFNI